MSAPFPNAAPPPGALLDNAPTAPVAALPTLAHLTPATRIAKGRDGQWYAKNVLMQYGAPVPLALALQRVAMGRTVYVRREDAAAVMGAANGADG